MGAHRLVVKSLRCGQFSSEEPRVRLAVGTAFADVIILFLTK